MKTAHAWQKKKEQKTCFQEDHKVRFYDHST